MCICALTKTARQSTRFYGMMHTLVILLLLMHTFPFLSFKQENKQPLKEVLDFEE